MKISKLKVNHQYNPIGICGEDIKFSFEVTEGYRYEIKIYKDDETTLVHNQVIEQNEVSGTYIDFPYEKGRRYYWCVSSDQYTSTMAYFEIANDLTNKFITPASPINVPKFFTTFEVKEFVDARLVITGLGLYRAYINGIKVGDNYLTPFFNDYDDCVRYQTYDINHLLKSETNKIEVIVGDGWYKSRFGIDQFGGDNTYGNQYLLNAKIILYYADGSTKTIESDKNWKCQSSFIQETSIYDGEIRNDLINTDEEVETKVIYTDYKAVPDFSSPIRAKIQLKPELIINSEGEKILDFKQNMVGVCRFKNTLPRGQKIKLSFGEILQNNVFYNKNYRTAKSIYEYVSDGIEKDVEALFTFYGFRYVLVEGIEDVHPEDFTGIVLYSDLEETLSVETSHDKLNQLMKNALWGQRGNFLDVPTDCPQRDERLGWTADAQVFVNTACYHMDAFNFYKKYIRDLRYDQVTYYEGDLPMYSPSLKKSAGNGGAVWSDAATIIPWNLYQAYGDQVQLQKNYVMMKDYVQTLIQKDEENNNTHIIQQGFTFGDWLAQDGVCDQAMKGGTDDTYIKTMYYYHSIILTGKTAQVLGKHNDAITYFRFADQVKQAIINEFFSNNGRLSIDTQTAYILALTFNVYIDKQRVIEAFRERLRKDFYKIKTGFVGTPLLLPALFENGMVTEAYRILFNEELPGWFYAINLGATTIWERWNSLNPDGIISGTLMNSFNHYAFGSVCEAIYAYIAGLKNEEPGWKKVSIAPRLSFQLYDMKIAYQSPIGKYVVEWSRDKKNNFKMSVTIPYGGEATLTLPDYKGNYNKTLHEGTYQYAYVLTKDYIHPFSSHSYVMELLENTKARVILEKNCPIAYQILTGENKEFQIMRFIELSYLDMFGLSQEQIKKVDKLLGKIEV